MITLPDKPKGEQYENVVASFIRCLGYFSETRLILHSNGREILELDIVATPASENYGNKILVDAKSGRTGFADIFKIYGWMTFLDISRGFVVRQVPPSERDMELFDEYAPKLNVFVKTFSKDDTQTLFETLPTVFKADNTLRNKVFIAGWYAATAERLCCREFNLFKKNNPELEIVNNIRQYDRACRVAFFEKDPLERVHKLYSAFKKTPGLSGQCVNWIVSNENISKRDAQDKLFDTGEYPWAQYVMLLEHRARILILKNAVEALEKYDSDDIRKNLKLFLTPDSFQRSFELIKEHPHRYKLPYLLHLFIEVFGGFYLSYEGYNKDLEMLSAATHIPEDDVISCLEIINDFFPTHDGMFIPFKNELYRIKFMPAIWMGIGCFLRRGYLFENNYREIAPIMGRLLTQYHNVLYNTLWPELGVEEQEEADNE